MLAIASALSRTSSADLPSALPIPNLLPFSQIVAFSSARRGHHALTVLPCRGCLVPKPRSQSELELSTIRSSLIHIKQESSCHSALISVRMMFAGVLRLTVPVIVAVSAAAAVTQDAYTWDNVFIGGGGGSFCSSLLVLGRLSNYCRFHPRHSIQSNSKRPRLRSVCHVFYQKLDDHIV